MQVWGNTIHPARFVETCTTEAPSRHWTVTTYGEVQALCNTFNLHGAQTKRNDNLINLYSAGSVDLREHFP